MQNSGSYDYVVVGAGLVGLATARALLQRHSGASLLVVDKEEDIAQHQSGRNSGVLHSGIYYPPDSLKAKLTASSRQKIVEICREQGIAYEACGKVILAQSEDELPGLKELQQRGLVNGLQVELVDSRELKEIEPYAEAVAALWVPEAGIVDFLALARWLAEDVQRMGGVLRLGFRVLDVKEERGSVFVRGSSGNVSAGKLINCAGLFSDRVARMAGLDAGVRSVPFRGEYFRLRPEAREKVKGLIYPLPDPTFPFLGVHLTRRIDGEVLAGPNAVFSPAREGYRRTDFDWRDLLDSLSYPGFWRLALGSLGTGLGEMARAWSAATFARSLQRLVPTLSAEDLLPAPAGVRAQALDRHGKLVDDFHFVKGRHSLHVVNAPSPAATACLAIGDYVARSILFSKNSNFKRVYR